MNRRKMRALDASPGGWGEVGSDDLSRYTKRKPDQRRGPRWCPYDCGQRATHYGMANGVVLASGCEFHMFMWVRASDEQRAGESPDG